MTAGGDKTNPLIYTFEVEIDLLKLDPKYPKNPTTFGQQIRKARMDRRMMVKELAERVSVVPETVINGEKRNLKPTRKHVERIRAVIGLDAETVGSNQAERQSQS
jgi:ribosome-binding protein aMBF1 (putative translation factor)